MPTGIYKRNPKTEKLRRKKISKSLIGNKRTLGYKASEATKKKMSDSQKRIGNKPPIMYGENHPSWLGGENQGYPLDWTETLKISIRERDNYICRICGIHQNELNGFFKNLDVHHIDYDKFNLNHKNLIILCRSCHCKTNFNREYWINYFNEE